MKNRSISPVGLSTRAISSTEAFKMGCPEKREDTVRVIDQSRGERDFLKAAVQILTSVEFGWLNRSLSHVSGWVRAAEKCDLALLALPCQKRYQRVMGFHLRNLRLQSFPSTTTAAAYPGPGVRV